MKFVIILFLMLLIACQKENSQPIVKLSGEKLYIEKSCITCHSIEGARMIGPPLNNIFGQIVYHNDGTSSIVDKEYLIESIKYPSVKISKGYDNQMNSYIDLLSDDEIEALVGYIKDLR